MLLNGTKREPIHAGMNAMKFNLMHWNFPAKGIRSPYASRRGPELKFSVSAGNGTGQKPRTKKKFRKGARIHSD